MDKFENYLFEKIGDYKNKIADNEGSPEVVWALNTCIEEMVEIFSVYSMEYKQF